MEQAPLKLYGIRNCDTVRRARRWLDESEIEYQFVDFRRDGVDATQLSIWIDALGADGLVNRRSRTWRDLKAADDLRWPLPEDRIRQLALAHPTLIRRPLFQLGERVFTGFDPQVLGALCEDGS